jgi:hypothetical protein
MRLLHPQTLFTLATSQELDFSKSTVSRKQAISHGWSEGLKFLATRQPHPKMWLEDKDLAVYMRLVYTLGLEVGCDFKSIHLEKYPEIFRIFSMETQDKRISALCGYLATKFDEFYIMSDCVSFHFKGLNLGEVIFGKDRWRRIVPIESLQEIVRVTTKTLDKNKK